MQSLKGLSVLLVRLSMVLAGCAHSGFSSVSVSSTSMSNSGSDQRAQVGAKLAAVALRALAEAGPSVARDHTIVNGKSLSIEQTIQALAAQPKPVKCRVALVSDVLVITAETMTDAEGLRRWQAITEHEVARNREYRRHTYGKGQEFMLVVEDESESFAIGDAAFEQWEGQYDIPGIAYSVAPAPETYAMHASAVVRFWPTSRDTIRVRIDFEERS